MSRTTYYPTDIAVTERDVRPFYDADVVFRGKELRRVAKTTEAAPKDRFLCGRDRRRSGDPTLFRRMLCRLSYSTRPGFPPSGPDGTRTRDLRLDRPA